MKIVLISTDSLISHGIRNISAYLKQHQHEVTCIFMARWEYYLNLRYDQFIKKDFSEIKKIVSNHDLIGISCTSFNYYHAIHLKNQLEELNKIIVLGGTHATLHPEESLKYFDNICIGEGEEAFLDFVNRIEHKLNIYDTPNFWFKKNNQIIKNKLRPLIENMDSLPVPDFEFFKHYLFNGDKLIKLLPDHFKEIHYYGIYGCPHNCYFCGNLSIYKAFTNEECKRKKIRKKSIEKVLEDLKIISLKFPPQLPVIFNDATFFIRSISEFEYFVKEYKKYINRGLTVYTSPKTFTEKKFKLLTEAGLNTIEMGIQTGSENINIKIYNRNIKNKEIEEKTKIINRYKDKLKYPPIYDIIIRNPYENKIDKLETLKLLHRLPKPYVLLPFNLTFFPGTVLFKKGLSDGLIKSLEDQLKYLNEEIIFLLDIDFKKEIISIDDVITIMRRRVDQNFYGILYSELIDQFINRNIEQIPSKIKVIIPDNLVQLIKNKIPKEKDFLTQLYILRIVTFLREIPEETNEEIPVLSSSLENYNFTIKMLSDYSSYYSGKS